MAETGKTSKGRSGALALNDVITQSAMAFGQGAGTVNLTKAAARLMRKYFYTRFKHHLKNWGKNRLGLLAYARGLGWYAATVARTKGRVDIGKADIREAIRGFPCPI